MLTGTPLKRGPAFKVGFLHGGICPEEMAICLSDAGGLCEVACCYRGGPPLLEEHPLLAALFENGILPGSSPNGEPIGSSTR